VMAPGWPVANRVRVKVEMVYDTSPKTTTRAAHRGLLMEGLRLSTPKQDGHGSLRGLSCQSLIPYVHGEDCYIAAFGVVQAWSWTCVELRLRELFFCSSVCLGLL
jgi:hypothetical protein